MYDYDEYYGEEPEEPEEWPRDPAVDRAIETLQTFFDQSPKEVFYSTQIETTLERKFFHWITGKGLLEMAEARHIQRISVVIQEKTVNFYAHPKHRYLRRQLDEKVKLLERIFNSEFTRAIGRHGELMFDASLGRHGFRAEAVDTKTWMGRTWYETNHNLDRILTRDGRPYGVEIKNTQNYISHEELRIKLRLCEYLQIKPLFIMRFAPKSYIHEVIESSGFVLLFEDQMYPLGHTPLLTEVRQKLGLKVSSPRDVKEGDIQRFIRWHQRQINR